MLRILFLLLALAGIARAQDVQTGLKLATAQQLAGIPLASTPYSGQAIPKRIDLSGNMPPVGRQAHQDCVAWATGYALKSYQEKIEEQNPFIISGLPNNNAIFSPSFIYGQINNNVDGGSTFHDALNILSQQGAAKLASMPYDSHNFNAKPSPQQRDAAKNYKIDFWRQVNVRDIKEVKAQLVAGYPVLIGASVDQEFDVNGRSWSSTNPYIWNSRGHNSSGHAMVVVGYDDDYSAFKVMNSWGSNWGNQGFCWIDYLFFPNGVNEGYIVKDAMNGLPSQPQDPITSLPSNPTADLNVSFTISVQNNIPNPTWGPGMNFSGNVQIPANIGTYYQIVTKFYLNNGSNGKGLPVGSTSIQFALPDGSAVSASQRTPIPAGGGIFSWNSGMPYYSLNVPRGVNNVYGQYMPYRTNLIAEPVLYIDNFPVKTGQPIAFYVAL